jgi:hypothetical protein
MLLMKLVQRCHGQGISASRYAGLRVEDDAVARTFFGHAVDRQIRAERYTVHLYPVDGSRPLGHSA